MGHNSILCSYLLLYPAAMLGPDKSYHGKMTVSPHRRGNLGEDWTTGILAAIVVHYH